MNELGEFSGNIIHGGLHGYDAQQMLQNNEARLPPKSVNLH